MMHTIKKVIRRTFLYNIIRVIRQRKEVRNWEKKGRPVPPPHFIKQNVVKEYASKFSIDILIETGTFLGDMVYATKNTFGRIFSIELDSALFKQAKKRFSKFNHIAIIQGDSGEILPNILTNISQSCLFWLDGHYSEGFTTKGKLETPIRQELIHILNHPITEHVILIDDARCFIGKNDYPTIEELENLIFERYPNQVFEIKDDIIRIHKP